MPILDAEGIVLRQYSLSEADRIIVFFTKEHGILRGVAPGSKKLKSRVGACLEPLNHVRIQYYLKKEAAELAYIRQCETLRSYLGRSPSVKGLYALTYVAEIVHEMSDENNPNQLLFRLLLATLGAAEKLGVRSSLLRYFEFWTLRLSGLLPDYGYCSLCAECVTNVGFWASREDGQGRCRSCSGERGLRVGPEAMKALALLSKLPPEEFASLPVGEEENRDLERLAQTLFELHLEKRLKSYPVLARMLRES
jgi:DNA repair protein RecO (recombination protein O)